MIMTNTPDTTELSPLPSPVDPPAGIWHIDPVHSTVGFTATHLRFARVRGRLGDVAGTVRIGLDPTDTTAEVRIAAASIDTGVPMRDTHLRSPEFFDVVHHPVITFASSQVRRDGTQWIMTGHLTITDVTRPVTLTGWYCGQEPFPFTGGRRLAFRGHTSIDRRDFGLTALAPFPGATSFIGNTVDIELDVSMADHDVSGFVASVLGRDSSV
jgi:polyisoprenoid-binding protein YceI